MTETKKLTLREQKLYIANNRVEAMNIHINSFKSDTFDDRDKVLDMTAKEFKEFLLSTDRNNYTLFEKISERRQLYAELDRLRAENKKLLEQKKKLQKK